jgi:hypothetical protein
MKKENKSDAARDRGAEGEKEAMSFPIGRSLAHAPSPPWDLNFPESSRFHVN